ncbi:MULTISPECIES: MFS transporter [Streptomyces]|uniref:MFS transporter n=2 Tax=Streptomyces TaxID=1883 RepID=A0A100YAH5_9ACTN|nr:MULTISPECIES: MFS transporter [Streptomyces]KUH40780.1 MFS transporter [Streptomyces kanasensis]UUS29446.1 MFS transporter [Streptomyces changanensis]
MNTSVRAARRATFAFFALNGFVMGAWIVHIPAVESRTGISHAMLGWLLLLLGAGAFVGMQLCGRLTDRVGARRVVPAGAVLCSAAVVLPALAVDAATLGAALFLLGFGNGCLDVSMNTHAVQVERGYGRPVMSAFHAVFSLGGVLAALVGARLVTWGWDLGVTLTAVAVTGLVVTLCATPALLGPPVPAGGGARSDGTASTGTAADGDGVRPAGRRRTPRRVWALAVLALLLMLCEGVANDWSVLHLEDVLGAPAATAAFAYGAFATAMTVGRLLTDRVAARTGPVFVVRYGASAAGVGLAVAALSPWVAPALVGWAVFGLGLSGCVPQFFSAAGHADEDAAGAHVSRVAGLGYLGMLAGPAVIGPLTHLVPLNLALLLPVALCAVAAAAAGVLRAEPPREADRSGRCRTEAV